MAPTKLTDFVSLQAELTRLRSENAELREALEIIEGGKIHGASILVLSGLWQQFCETLQKIARDALANTAKEPV